MKIKYTGDVSPIKIIENRGIVWETGKSIDVDDALGKVILNRYPTLFKKTYTPKRKHEKISKEIKEVEE